MSVIKINLVEIFEIIQDRNYSIIKLPEEFPSYKLGSDLDIFCYDIDILAKEIINSLQKYIDDKHNIEIEKRDGQMYIDVKKQDRIYFRFDLYDRLPKYYNLKIKEGFFSSIIENSQIKQIGELKIKVPSQIDEVILRYIEYHEWYVQRPDKIKHINYIEDQISKKGIDLDVFLDKLHFYTSIPKVLEERIVTKSGILRYIKYLLALVRKGIIMLKDKGLVNTIKVLAKKRKK